MLDSRIKYAYAHRRGMVILQYTPYYRLHGWSLTDMSGRMTKTHLRDWIYRNMERVKLVSRAEIKELKLEADKVPSS